MATLLAYTTCEQDMVKTTIFSQFMWHARKHDHLSNTRAHVLVYET
jgi:hypothetical protein